MKKLSEGYLADAAFKAKYLTDVHTSWVTSGAETAGDVANAISTLFGLFRTSITTSDNSVPSDNLGFLPALCNELSHAGFTPITPDLLINNSKILEDTNSFTGLMINVGWLRSLAGTYVTNVLNPAIATATEPTKTTLQSSAATFTALNASYDSFTSNLSGVGLPLGTLLQLDYLNSKLAEEKDSYLLYVTNNFAAGEMRVKSNPIIDIFFDGPRISFIGGAGVTYLLYKGNSATPILADHLDGYRGYRQFSKFTWFHYVPNERKK